MYIHYMHRILSAHMYIFYSGVAVTVSSNVSLGRAARNMRDKNDYAWYVAALFFSESLAIRVFCCNASSILQVMPWILMAESLYYAITYTSLEGYDISYIRLHILPYLVRSIFRLKKDHLSCNV